MLSSKVCVLSERNLFLGMLRRIEMIKSSEKVIIELSPTHDAKDLASRVVDLMGKFRILVIKDVKISGNTINLTAERPLFIDDAISFFYKLRAEGFNITQFSYNGEEPTPTIFKLE